MVYSGEKWGNTMFIGQYESNLDEKRRVSVPNKFRKDLGEKLILAKWYEKCLVLVGNAGWNVLLNRLGGNSRIITAPVRDTDRFVLGSAFALELDSQGRIIIPEKLTKYANLGKEIVFVGLGDRIEVWSKADWIKEEDYISIHAGEFIEKLADKDND